MDLTDYNNEKNKLIERVYAMYRELCNKKLLKRDVVAQDSVQKK